MLLVLIFLYFIVVYCRSDNPTIRVSITDKTTNYLSVTTHYEILRDTKTYEIIQHVNHKFSEVYLCTKSGHFLEPKESLISQGVKHGSKLFCRKY